MSSSYTKKGFIPVIKTCEICGKQFLCDSYIKFKNRKYCSIECRKEAKKILDKERAKKPTRYKEERERQKAFDKVLGPVLSPDKVMENFHKPKKKKGEVKDYLLEDAVAARANDMSYGQYTSQRYAPHVYIPPEYRR